MRIRVAIVCSCCLNVPLMEAGFYIVVAVVQNTLLAHSVVSSNLLLCSNDETENAEKKYIAKSIFIQPLQLYKSFLFIFTKI